MMLSLTCIDHTLANQSRAVGFRRGLATQLAKLHGGYVDMDVDAVQ